MKERPILFSTEMIKALLDGRKTMTRRVISKSGWLEQYGKVDLERDVEVAVESDDDKTKLLKGLCASFDGGEWVVKSKCEVGDILWVREKWKKNDIPMGWPYHYYANNDTFTNPDNEKWKPSIFMPKEACRIRLEITGIKVERVQDISEEDAIKEGVEQNQDGSWHDYIAPHRLYQDAAKPSFISLWQLINGEKSWNQNPWVWCIEFVRQESKNKLIC